MQIKQFVNNPFQENTYIVHDEQSLEAAIVDCGAMTERERDAMQYYIDGHQLLVKHLLNTHFHLDHCVGNAWAATMFGLTAEGSELDTELYNHLREQAINFGLPEQVAGDGVVQSIMPLDSKSVITIGSLSFSILPTPGHTPGGLCFYCAEENVLFSGDTLFNGSVGRTDLPGGSMNALIRSIREQLLPLPDHTTVYCGHGPATTIADEKRYNPFL